MKMIFNKCKLDVKLGGVLSVNKVDADNVNEKDYVNYKKSPII